VPGPLGDDACPPPPPASWRGDAGNDWSIAGWGMTLANHTLTPGAEPSCIAADGRTARIGASSGHQGGVQVLRGDGSVALVAPRVDPRVWRSLANIRDRDVK
jgi:hypothetical protein